MRDCKLETLIVPLRADALQGVRWQVGGVPEPPRYTNRCSRQQHGPGRWQASAVRALRRGPPGTIRSAYESRNCDENPEALVHARCADSQWAPAGRWNRTSWRMCDGLHRRALVGRARKPGTPPL